MNITAAKKPTVNSKPSQALSVSEKAKAGKVKIESEITAIIAIAKNLKICFLIAIYTNKLF